MQITEVRINLIQQPKSPKLLGFATIILEDCFVVTGIRIIDGPQRVFVAMPNRVTGSGHHTDVAFPIRKWLRDDIENAILDQYRRIFTD